MNTKDK